MRESYDKEKHRELVFTVTGVSVILQLYNKILKIREISHAFMKEDVLIARGVDELTVLACIDYLEYLRVIEKVHIGTHHHGNYDVYSIIF